MTHDTMMTDRELLDHLRTDHDVPVRADATRWRRSELDALHTECIGPRIDHGLEP